MDMATLQERTMQSDTCSCVNEHSVVLHWNTQYVYLFKSQPMKFDNHTKP